MSSIRFQYLTTVFIRNQFSGEYKNTTFILFFTSALFIFHPLAACFFSIITTFISNNKNGVSICLSFLWLFLILIQSQRDLKPTIDYLGDWGRYSDFYLQCSNLSIFHTEMGMKDPGFTLWNYVCSYFMGKNYLAYADFTVDIELLLFSLASYRIWKATDKDARTGLCAICMVLMFTEILLISNNLLRQMFASSIMIYGIVLRFTSVSKIWLFFIIWAFFTHSMTILFVPLLFLPLLRRPEKKQLVIIVGGCFCLVAFLILAKELLISSSVYIFQRIGGANEYIEDDVINPVVIYKFAIVVFLIYFKHYFSDKNINKYIWFGCNSIMYITLICLVTANMPLLVTRVYIDRLPLLSMFVPYIFTRPSQYNNIFLFGVIMFFLIRFAFMSHGDYLDVSEYALYPFFSLI